MAEQKAYEELDYQLRAAGTLRKEGINHTIGAMQPFVDPDRLPCQVGEIDDLIAQGSTERNLRRRGTESEELKIIWIPNCDAM